MQATTGSAAAMGLAALIALISIAPGESAPGERGQVQPVPGPGSGVVTVTGKVEVANDVGASQRGDWKVAIANVPDVRVTNTPTVMLAPPPFLRAGSRYEVVWPGGEREILSVAQAAAGGWVRVDSPRTKWVNLTGARSVEERP